MKPFSKANLSLIRERAVLLRELRHFFDEHQFLEVQPPCLSADCIVDSYIDPIQVSSDQLRLGIDLPTQYYLQTSPESAMKRMLASGAPSIYSMGPVFRAGERGVRHNIEFTMLEWYQVGADMEAGIQTLGQLAAELFQSDGFDVCNYRQLFQQSVGLDPVESPIEKLRESLADIDPALVQSSDRDSLLDALLTSMIEPTLGNERPLVVKNYPISQAALACVAPDDPQCASRFELFVHGTELANGYDELQDADVLVARTHAHNQNRVATGRPPIEIDSAVIAAMRSGLPKCSGVAMGVDRLLMIRSAANSIDQTIPFPIEHA